LFMRTVGEILSEARTKKEITLEEAEKATKIRKKILQDLEKGNWNYLPATSIKGLLKNYASFLSLDEKRILAFFRREYDEKRAAKIVKPPQKMIRRFRLTPAVVTSLMLAGVVVVVFLYLFSQYRSFTAAPLLEIEEPKEGAKVSSLEVNVVGRTWDDATLKINGEQVQISPGGTFSVEVRLKEGVNDLTITSANRFGKISTVKRTVVVELTKSATMSAGSPP